MYISRCELPIELSLTSLISRSPVQPCAAGTYMYSQAGIQTKFPVWVHGTPVVLYFPLSWPHTVNEIRSPSTHLDLPLYLSAL